jgi:hypothetical protein
MDTPGSYASFNGLEMYYEIHGAGDPSVVHHVVLGTIESFFATRPGARIRCG